MSAECCGTEAESRLPARRGTRGQGIASLLGFAPAALLAIAVPKCPLCLAAQLAFLGVSVGAASAIASFLSPLRISLAILALGLLLRASPLVRGHWRLVARWLRPPGVRKQTAHPRAQLSCARVQTVGSGRAETRALFRED